MEVMAAVGKRGPIEHLPPKLQEIEKPSSRKRLEEIVFEGTFKRG
jgi:hypothetical protein